MFSKVYLREYDSSAHHCPEYPSVCDILREINLTLLQKFVENAEKQQFSPMQYRYFNWKQKFYNHLEYGDWGADDEDEDVRHGEVDEEHVDHGLEAGAGGHWQDDLNISKCQIGYSLWFRAWSTLIITQENEK